MHVPLLWQCGTRQPHTFFILSLWPSGSSRWLCCNLQPISMRASYCSDKGDLPRTSCPSTHCLAQQPQLSDVLVTVLPSWAPPTPPAPPLPLFSPSLFMACWVSERPAGLLIFMLWLSALIHSPWPPRRQQCEHGHGHGTPPHVTRGNWCGGMIERPPPPVKSSEAWGSSRAPLCITPVTLPLHTDTRPNRKIAIFVSLALRPHCQIMEWFWITVSNPGHHSHQETGSTQRGHEWVLLNHVLGQVGASQPSKLIPSRNTHICCCPVHCNDDRI